MSQATNQTEIVNIQFKGLVTNPNELTVAQGGLTIAENVAIDNDNLVESRRGFRAYGTTLAADVGTMFSWKDKLLLHQGTTLMRDSDDAGVWVAYAGTFTPPLGNRLHSSQSNRNLYFTSAEGIQKLDSVTGVPVASGIPKGLDLNLALIAGTILPNLMAVAYRIVWAFTDSNDNLILGSPSQRVEIFNTSGGARDIRLNFSIPSQITTAHKYQIYRSKAVPTTSVGGPSDELQLAFDGSPTAGDITAKFVSVDDSTIEAVLTTDLYTNASQEGIAQTNDVAPLSTDLTTYKNHTFYSNTQERQKGTINLLAVGAPNGIQIGDTLTINGIVFTGAAVENTATGSFLISVIVDPAGAIEETALSIVKVINRFATNTTLNAYYGSGVEDAPGQIIVEARLFSTAQFFFVTSRTTAFTPVLTGTNAPSTSNRKRNRIQISKNGRPEAVPLSNFVDVGSAEKAILRVLALKDALFIIKADGVYLLTGDVISAFRVQEHDPTVFIRGKETAIVFNNRIMMMSNQGVVSIDENGVTVKSREIEDRILLYNSPLFTTFEAIAHGISYESDRKYILLVPLIAADATAAIAYVFNVFTESWTTWNFPRTAGIVSTRDDKLYLANPVTDKVTQERKNFILSDHADEEFSVTITSFIGTTVNLVSTALIAAGMTLKQMFRESVVVTVVSATQITVANVETWVAAAATVFSPIACKIRWKFEDATDPSLVKQFNDIQYFFRQAAFSELEVGFATNFKKVEALTTLSAQILTGWGESPWGSEAWGGDPNGTLEVRTLAPEDMARGLWLIMSLKTEQAFTRFSSAGCAISVRGISEKY